MRFGQLRLIAAMCSLMMFAMLACAATAKTEVVDQTMQLSAEGLVTLKNINGTITIHSWQKDEVRVLAEKRAKPKWGMSAEDLLQAWKVEIGASRDRIDIETIRPEKRDKKWRQGITVTYELWVPESASLELRNTNGKIDVERLNGQIQARTTNGNVHLEGVGGTAECATTNGNITIEEARGWVDAQTTNGSIRATLLEFDGRDMDLHTTNGGITLSLPGNVGVNLDASTTNGSVRSDLPITVSGKISKRRVSGEVNGGGPRIKLKTTNGSIKLLEI